MGKKKKTLPGLGGRGSGPTSCTPLAGLLSERRGGGLRLEKRGLENELPRVLCDSGRWKVSPGSGNFGEKGGESVKCLSEPC